MTKREAKELALEIWRYLSEHALFSKTVLPDELWGTVRPSSSVCSLCETYGNCGDCLLYKYGNICLLLYNICFSSCFSSGTTEDRKKYAGEIMRIIEAWEIEEGV